MIYARRVRRSFALPRINVSQTRPPSVIIIDVKTLKHPTASRFDTPRTMFRDGYALRLVRPSPAARKKHDRNTREIARSSLFANGISIVLVLLPSPGVRLREVNQFRVKVPKEGTVLRSGRMQVRRKSECLKESRERESAHRCTIRWRAECSRGRGKLDEARFSKRRLFFPVHWAVQSFRKSRLLRNYGPASSIHGDARPAFVNWYFARTGANNEARS